MGMMKMNKLACVALMLGVASVRSMDTKSMDDLDTISSWYKQVVDRHKPFRSAVDTGAFTDVCTRLMTQCLKYLNTVSRSLGRARKELDQDSVKMVIRVERSYRKMKDLLDRYCYQANGGKPMEVQAKFDVFETLLLRRLQTVWNRDQGNPDRFLKSMADSSDEETF